MQIVIKTLNAQIITLDVKPTESIDIVKHKIQDNGGYLYYQQQLLDESTKKTLEDGMDLSDYNIQDGCKILLIWRNIQTIVQYNQLKSSNENLAKYESDIIIQRLRCYLNKNTKLKSTANRILNIINLMKYLCTQPKFIQKHLKLKHKMIHQFKYLKNEINIYRNAPSSLIDHFDQTYIKINEILL